MSEDAIRKRRDEMHGLLKEEIVQVIFTKADGSTREMVCTLKEDMIPHVPMKDEEPEKKYRPGPLGTIACYDLEKQGWRSFRLDSLITYKVIPENGYPC